MTRTLLSLALGMAIGAAVTYGFVAGGQGGPKATRGAGAPEASMNPGVLLDQAATPVALESMIFSARAAIYAQAAQTSSARDLEAILGPIMASPPSNERDFKLETLLRRLAGIDSERAVRFALERGIETRFLLPVYQVWAASEPDAALAALSEVANVAAARAVALSLLHVLGDDARGISRVLAVLPGVNAATFLAEALAEKAETAPQTALQDALALDDPVTRRRALGRVATAWARREPETALSQLYVIADPDLSRVFQANVLTEWASLDPDAVLGYLSGELEDRGIGPLQVGFGALQVVAEESPQSVLDFADSLPGDMRTRARELALNPLAQRDAVAALAQVETLPEGQERDRLMQTIARHYSREDPDAALAWARSLGPGSSEVTRAVLGGIAELDADRALSLALQSTAGGERQRFLQAVLVRTAMRGDDQAESMANRLVTLEDPLVRDQALNMLTAVWASRNAEQAFTWALANQQLAGRGVFNEIAERLGQQDPARAATYTNQIPVEYRETWIGRIADGYARVDPVGALSWVGQLQGQPGRDRAVAAIAQRSAASDPQQAARLLDSVDLTSQAASQATATVANRWAEQSPRAAAQWAGNIGNARARSGAVSKVAAAWVQQDSDAATAWVLNLGSGETRDAALGALVGSLAATSLPDRALLDAFSTDRARQEGLRSAIYPLAARDPDEARALIDTYITDPSIRSQAERMLESALDQGRRFFFR